MTILATFLSCFIIAAAVIGAVGALTFRLLAFICGRSPEVDRDVFREGPCS